jgi:type II secretory pathway pseudopilin PulG
MLQVSSLFRPLNQKGISLIQVMVAVGIMGILTLVFASFIANMQTEQKFLQQKSDALLAQAMIDLHFLKNQSNCTQSLKGYSFDPNNPPTHISIDDLVSWDPINNTEQPIVQSPASSLTGGIEVGAITLSNFSNLGGGTFSGRLSVHFNSEARAMKPYEFLQAFNVVGGQIDSCGYAPTSAPDIVTLGIDESQAYPANACPNGWKVTPSVSVYRTGQNSATHWVGGGLPQIDGVRRFDLSVEFGSSKSGGAGHGWMYFARGVSRSYHLPPSGPISLDPTIPHTITYRVYIGERAANFAPDITAFVGGVVYGQPNLYIIIHPDSKMLVECLK